MTGVAAWAAALFGARWRFPTLIERIYAAVTIYVGGTWLSAATAVGPSVPLLGEALVIGAVILSVPWWGVVTYEPDPSGESPNDKDPDLIKFSDEATTEVKAYVVRYLLGLEEISRSIAASDGLDYVSPPHVRRAADVLGLNARKKFTWQREVGALLIGVGLTSLSAVILASSYTFLAGLLISIPILGGFGLYFYGIARD